MLAFAGGWGLKRLTGGVRAVIGIRSFRRFASSALTVGHRGISHIGSRHSFKSSVREVHLKHRFSAMTCDPLQRQRADTRRSAGCTRPAVYRLNAPPPCDCSRCSAGRALLRRCVAYIRFCDIILIPRACFSSKISPVFVANSWSGRARPRRSCCDTLRLRPRIFMAIVNGDFALNVNML